MVSQGMFCCWLVNVCLLTQFLENRFAHNCFFWVIVLSVRVLQIYSVTNFPFGRQTKFRFGHCCSWKRTFNTDSLNQSFWIAHIPETIFSHRVTHIYTAIQLHFYISTHLHSYTPTHLHISTATHLHSYISKQLHPLHSLTPKQLYTPTHPHTYTPTHRHINTP